MRPSSLARKRAAIIGATTAALVMASAATVWANPFGWTPGQPQPHSFQAKDDKGGPTGNVLTNDHGATVVVNHSALSDPSAGTLVIHADGSYTFTPANPNSHGTVTF